MNLDIPRDEGGPVFNAPWEAHAFGLTVKLHERGVFSWQEWAAALAAVIREAGAAGEPDRGDTYYLHWVKALERLVIGRGLADATLLAALADAVEKEAEHRREQQLS
ncbi:MAG: nitrile hydratase accessory protein [Betaproteobacteria bacterium]